MSDDLDLSVVICTRDRAADLARTLEALAAVRVPAGLAWEVVVVDNGSTDDTPSAIRHLAGRLPIRRVEEPVPGLSVARNRGVDAARGGAILWTDDDVTVGPDWVETYVDALRRHPECGFFGGPIRPRFESLPGWARAAWPHVSLYFAAREAVAEGAVHPDYVPFGANFAIRSDVQARYPYDPALGRRPGDLRSGEEWDVLQRALADGVAGRWVPATVEHRIPAGRATIGHVCGVARAMGRVGAESLGADDGWRWRGRPLWLWRSFAWLSLRYGLARIAGGPARWVPLALERARVRGHLDGAGAVAPGGTARP